jgi:hypothetical protein
MFGSFLPPSPAPPFLPLPPSSPPKVLLFGALQLLGRLRSGGSQFNASLGKKLTRTHLKQQIGCGGAYLKS